MGTARCKVKLLSAGVIGAGIIMLLSPSAVEGQGLSGTYRLMVCSGPCEPGDTSRVVAEGHLVLFESADFLGTLPDSAREKLTRRSIFYLASKVANACFSIPRRQPEVGGRELYAGIHPRGVTNWTQVEGRVQIRIYQSPDAHYTLEGRAEGTDLIGEGRQAICCGYGPPPETSFLAQRIGAPDPQVCLR